MSDHKICDILDLEEFSKTNNGAKPPKSKQYRIKIDKKKYDVSESSLTGRQLLEKANKNPVERYQINQKKHGGVVEPIGLDESADFTQPGIERFMTLPLDQQEG